jgi:hypothetical protein
MDMILFLILILKMGHDMTDCWSKTEKFYIWFYSNTIKQDRILHVLHFLNFKDLAKESGKDDKNHDMYGKLQKFLKC